MTDFEVFDPKRHMTRDEADAMVAAAFEQAQHVIQIAWEWPESAVSSAPACEAIAKLTPADARAALDWIKEETFIRGAAAGQEDSKSMIAEAVEEDRRLLDINAAAMAEIKATIDGDSDQSVRDIVYGALAEIAAIREGKE